MRTGSSGNEGNNSNEGGGGVYVYNSFTKTGGVIYGASSDASSNKATTHGIIETNRGAAVYADSTHRRDTTVSTEQNMSKSGSSYTGAWSD
jgi:hypothetical protein